MAFTAGLKAPKAFSGTNTTQYKNTFDRLVTVKEYDVAKGYMIAEDDKGKRYEVFVNPEENRRAEEALAKKGTDKASITWMGHSIDEKMKKSIPVGSKVILIRSHIVQNDKIRDLSLTEVHRIGGVPDPKTDKTFQGIFTMTYHPEDGKERISRVQHWNPIAVNLQDEDGLNKLKDLVDSSRANYGKKIGEYNVTEPTIGVQFRALVKTDQEYAYATDPSKKAIFEVVDMSLPFDWMPGPQDETGKEMKDQAHVITGDEVMSFAELYVDYISSNEQFKDNLDNMEVEICYYHAYPASKGNLDITTGIPEKDKNADKNPLYQLSHRKSFIDLAHTESITGRNAAVNGIIQISSNKLAEVGDQVVKIPNYWVTKIHANNTRGHVHAFIRTANGHKAKPHELLDLVKTEQGANSANKPAASREEDNSNVSNSHSNHVASTLAASTTEFDPFATSGDGDPFATSEATSTQKAPLRFGLGAKKED